MVEGVKMEKLNFLKNKYLKLVNVAFLFIWLIFLFYIYLTELLMLVNKFFAEEIVNLFYFRSVTLLSILILTAINLYFRFIKKISKSYLILTCGSTILFYEVSLLIITRTIFNIYKPYDLNHLIIVLGWIAILLVAWLVDEVNK